MNLTSMKVGTRLLVGFAVVLALLVLVTFVGIFQMGTIEDRLVRVVDVNNVASRLVLDMRSNVSERILALKQLTLLPDVDSISAELPKIKEKDDAYAKLQKDLSDLFAKNGSQQEKDLLAAVKENDAAAMAAIPKATDAWVANNAADAMRIYRKEVKPVQAKWLEALDKLAAAEDKLSTQTKSDAEGAYRNAFMTMLGLGGFAVLAGFVLAAGITRGLLKQLGGEPDYTAEIAGSIAHGDLAVYIDTEKAEHGSLLSEMKSMRDSLVGIVGQVRNGTETIGTASREIAAGNIDLSSRTEMQASALEKTASAMEELTSTVKQNADNAREANMLAASASDVARKGGDVVSQVVDTMGSINESANKIVDIIGVIDGIAFQTNILALNAAVEAARAGEQGRGFAVVASEVRNLAQRSAAAAKEIKTLIGDSVEKVERGSKLVGQAGVTMDEVVSSVRRVTDIMSEIASASQEQSAGIEQVNLSIIEMDSMTQQNAALVEEAAAAAQSLQDQANELARVVSIFKLQEGEQAYVPPAAMAVAAPAAEAPAPTQNLPVRAVKPALKTPKKEKPAPAPAPAADEWEEF